MAQEVHIPYKSIDDLRKEFVTMARDPRVLEEDLIECLEEFVRAIIEEELSDFFEK